MLAKPLIGLNTVHYLYYCLTEVFVLCTVCTHIKSYVLDGKTVCESFTTTKQGAVISPIICSVYMDGLLAVLVNRSYDCYKGGVFVGTFTYVDDHKRLTPSVYYLHQIDIF